MSELDYENLSNELYYRLCIFTPIQFALNQYSYPVDVFKHQLNKVVKDVLPSFLPDNSALKLSFAKS